MQGQRCFAIGFAGKGGYCFEQGSHMPETIKYGCVLFGFALLYAGRRQIKRARGWKRRGTGGRTCPGRAGDLEAPRRECRQPDMTANIGRTKDQVSCVFITIATPT